MPHQDSTGTGTGTRTRSSSRLAEKQQHGNGNGCSSSAGGNDNNILPSLTSTLEELEKCLEQQRIWNLDWKKKKVGPKQRIRELFEDLEAIWRQGAVTKKVVVVDSPFPIWITTQLKTTRALKTTLEIVYGDAYEADCRCKSELDSAARSLFGPASSTSSSNRRTATADADADTTSTSCGKFSIYLFFGTTIAHSSQSLRALRYFGKKRDHNAPTFHDLYHCAARIRSDRVATLPLPSPASVPLPLDRYGLDVPYKKDDIMEAVRTFVDYRPATRKTTTAFSSITDDDDSSFPPSPPPPGPPRTSSTPELARRRPLPLPPFEESILAQSPTSSRQPLDKLPALPLSSTPSSPRVASDDGQDIDQLTDNEPWSFLNDDPMPGGNSSEDGFELVMDTGDEDTRKGTTSMEGQEVQEAEAPVQNQTIYKDKIASPRGTKRQKFRPDSGVSLSLGNSSEDGFELALDTGVEDTRKGTTSMEGKEGQQAEAPVQNQTIHKDKPAGIESFSINMNKRRESGVGETMASPRRAKRQKFEPDSRTSLSLSSESKTSLALHNDAGWLNSSTILAFIRWAVSHRSTWRVADPLLLKAKTESRIALHWQTAEVIIMPFLVGGNHWLLMVFYVGNRKILVYDSRPGDQHLGEAKAQAERFVEHVLPDHVQSQTSSASNGSDPSPAAPNEDSETQEVQEVQQVPGPSNASVWDCWALSAGQCPMQDNTWDCGLLVIVRALQLVCDEPDQQTRLDGAVVRRWLISLVAVAEDAESVPDILDEGDKTADVTVPTTSAVSLILPENPPPKVTDIDEMVGRMEEELGRLRWLKHDTFSRRLAATKSKLQDMQRLEKLLDHMYSLCDSAKAEFEKQKMTAMNEQAEVEKMLAAARGFAYRASSVEAELHDTASGLRKLVRFFNDQAQLLSSSEEKVIPVSMAKVKAEMEVLRGIQEEYASYCSSNSK